MYTEEIVDTHCHLYLEQFAADLPDIISRSDNQRVTGIYMPSLDKAHMAVLLETEAKFPGKCFAMAGVHPCYIGEDYRDQLRFMEDWLQRRSFAAVGEIGLDYYWDRTFDGYQKIAFVEQIRMAVAHKLPIVIHSRSSMEDCIRIVEEEGPRGLKGGIFHCFSGTLEDARRIIDCGLLLGIGGVVTYKNSGLAPVVKQLPIEHIVLETDAPYLAPVPFRGKRNESSYLQYIVARIAELKGLSEDEVARSTTANARRVFGSAW